MGKTLTVTDDEVKQAYEALFPDSADIIFNEKLPDIGVGCGSCTHYSPTLPEDGHYCEMMDGWHGKDGFSCAAWKEQQ